MVIAHDPRGKFDVKALRKQAQEWGGLEGLDLVPKVTRTGQEVWGGGGLDAGPRLFSGPVDQTKALSPSGERVGRGGVAQRFRQPPPPNPLP